MFQAPYLFADEIAAKQATDIARKLSLGLSALPATASDPLPKPSVSHVGSTVTRVSLLSTKQA
jgi:hypothetical protein